MGFRVPWRCLLPEDSVEHVFGSTGGSAISQATGARVHISEEGEAPETLSDKIVKLEGSAPQIEDACRYILKDLWTSQGIPQDDEGIFVLVIPARVVGAIIGTKGAKVMEIMGGSGADLNVGRECIIGMPDNPVVVKGTQEQVLTATAMTHVVLQELADRGRLEPGDFVWVPGRSTEAPRLGPGPRSGLGSCPAARFRFPSGVAGFVIGKGGLKIKKLKEESGALLQFRSADEEPAVTLDPDERVLEIRGDPSQRNQAVRSLFLTVDEMPDGPRGTRFLVPTTLERGALEELSNDAGVELALGKDTRLGSPEPGEVTAELQGPASARLEVVLGALALMDSRVGISTDRSAGPPPTARGPPRTTEQERPPPGLERSAERPSMASQPPSHEQATTLSERASEKDQVERRVEPETGKAFTWEEFKEAFAATYSPDEIRDYWRDACKPAPPVERARLPEPREEGNQQREQEQLQQLQQREQRDREQWRQQQRELELRERREQEQREREFVGRELQGRGQGLGEQQEEREHRQREEEAEMEEARRRRARQEEEERIERETVRQRQAEQEEQERRMRLQEQRRREEEAERKRREDKEREREHQQQLAANGHVAEQAHTPQAGKAPQPCFFQPAPNPAAEMHDRSSSSQETFPPQNAPSSVSFCGAFAPFCNAQAFGPMGMGAGMGMGMGMGLGMGMGGLHWDPMTAAQTQLHLVLPSGVVHKVLAPSGHLAEIASGCNVRIDLCEEVSPGQLRVALSGTCVANSLATLALQGRVWFAQASAGTSPD